MTEAVWIPSPPLTREQRRPRVDAALRAALQQPVVVLCAAAGYGKTVAAHAVWNDWTGARGWLTLRADEQDAARGTLHLVAAARQAFGLPIPAGADLPTLLAELTHAPGGLLIVDDLSAWPSAAIWGALGQIIAAMPLQCHVLLLCRHAPPLPVALWRSQGRLAWLDHGLLAMTPDEWQQAGYAGDHEACSSACGWWGAAEAARAGTSGPWNAPLAAWLDEAWFGALPPDQQRVLGLASLLPGVTLDELAALAGVANSLCWQDWALLDAHPGPILKQADTLAIAPAYRFYTSQAWRRHDGEAWARACSRGVTWLLQRNQPVRALGLAWECGLPELQEQVLAAAGWHLLYCSARAALAPLLLQGTLTAVGSRLLQCAWQIEVDKTPHLAEPIVERLLGELTGEARGQALALLASVSWQYDDVAQTLERATQALQELPGNLQPAHALALLLQANALAGMGHLSDAEPLLRRAQALAARDGLLYLQLDILQRRAQLAGDSGEITLAMQLLGEGRTLAQRHDVQTAYTLDSGGRLLASLHLQRLALEEADATAQTAAAGIDEQAFWAFPHRILRALVALARRDLGVARHEVEWMTRRLGEQFHCHKWQNDAALAQIWLAALTLDHGRLAQLEAQLQQCDWGAGQHRDRRRVLLAGLRLLRGQTDDLAELGQLDARLELTGAGALHATLQLILALARHDRQQLLVCIRRGAARGLALDFIWLGPVAIGPLEQLLGAPELIHDSGALAFLRTIVQHQLAPAATADAAIEPSEPPAGLTAKEWQILQLIGQQLTNEQIAARLFVSLATVKTHINHLYGKLDIRTRAEAIHRARHLAA